MEHAPERASWPRMRWGSLSIIVRGRPRSAQTASCPMGFPSENYEGLGKIPNWASASTVFSIGKPTTLVNEPSISSIISAPLP
jgi:hypothetical protein